jgi:hypothetical protein
VLAVSALANGDGTAIASTEYRLLDRNRTPYTCLALNETSAIAWTYDAYGNDDQVIAITAMTGYRERYTREAWRATGATLAAAITTTSATTFTCTTGKVTAGMIIKIEDEIMLVSAVSTSTSDTVTVTRGENGSTAATHLISSVIYQWITQQEISQAVLDIAMSKYKRLYGDGAVGTVKVTSYGVVIMPQDVPDHAQDTINLFQRHV